MSALPILNTIREWPLSAGQFGTASARFWAGFCPSPAGSPQPAMICTKIKAMSLDARFRQPSPLAHCPPSAPTSHRYS
jgi:hypothetical protein